MEVESDGVCAEGCELDEFIYDDDELMESAIASPQSKGLIPRYHSPESLDRRIDELIRETAALMGLNEAFVGILLRKFDWRSDALIQEWFNDSAAVLRKGRLPPVVLEQDREDAPGAAECESAPAEPEASDSSLKTPCTSVDVSKKEEAGDMFECPVTACVVPLTETFALKCSHRYSNAAWIGYLDALVTEGPQRALDARCPFPGCLELVTMDVWNRFRGPSAVARLRMFAREQFVGKHLAVAWCPSPMCQQAVELVPAGVSCSDSDSFCNFSAAEVALVADVTCSCGARFCVMCGEEPHRPISCRVIAAWRRKNVREADSVTWISCNTQPCPKCRRPIQKDKGCMHMRCYCQHEFCWLCLGDWKQHSTRSFYRCNVYEQRGGEAKEGSGSGDAQHSLERYAHFFERYRAHNHGQQVAARMQLSQLKRCREVAAAAAGLSPTCAAVQPAADSKGDKAPHSCASESSSPSRPGERGGMTKSRNRDARYSLGFGEDFDWDFLEKGWLQVVECRRMLKWSYAFAFFAEFPESRQKHLFEFHQGQLERSLDLLQEKLETFEPKAYVDRDPADLITFKMQLLDLTAIVRGFFAKICDVFEDEFVAHAVHVNERETG
ncbi:IBR domain-containing protein, putative [Eimeria necatrix]|uniref:RBR-type E3 ubiquitin transferase n=1 Tax=Eimeria necatrix TaxID=51315 RepID=U6MV23_9EIME|nr:IBR domain-containing protein, putative [Eimeria necatrix]CDJ67856.1 IBR domain-containing protein, putative [Eimeria necatrix]